MFHLYGRPADRTVSGRLVEVSLLALRPDPGQVCAGSGAVQGSQLGRAEQQGQRESVGNHQDHEEGEGQGDRADRLHRPEDCQARGLWV